MQQDLDKYRFDFEIVRETAAQVVKDFSVAGFEIYFSGNELLAYEELKKQIEPVLQNLFYKDPGQFQNLLYRIDIDEKKLKNLLLDPDTNKVLESLSELILQREFQKILTRRFYS